MDWKEIVDKIFACMTIIVMGLCILILILMMIFAIQSELKETKNKKQEYLKECERKAIVYDYIMENKEE